MKKLLFLLIVMILLGCSHEVTVKPTVSPVAYKLMDQKVEGNIAVFIHPELADLKMVVEPQSRYCGSSSFPFQAGQSIKASLIKPPRAFSKIAVRLMLFRRIMGLTASWRPSLLISMSI